MRPMLDDMELQQVQELATYDRRMVAQHEIPGLKGSLLQNMGRRPGRILLWGVASGAEALTYVETLDTKFRAGAPLTFVADITTDTNIETVLIEDLKWEELAGKPNRYAYALIMNEYIEPTAPASGATPNIPGIESPIDSDILGDAQGLLDDITDVLDAIPNIDTEIIDQLSKHLDKMTDLLRRLTAFTEQ